MFQKNPFYAMAILYLVLDVLALAALALWTVELIPPIAGIVWIRVHLLTIGVVTQAILGTLPGLVASRSGTPAPGPKVTWALWLLVNGSFAVLLVGVPTNISGVAIAGALGIFAAIVLLLGWIWRAADGRAAIEDARLRIFLTSPLYFLVGIVLAIALLARWPAPGGSGGVLEAHIHANVWGFFGLLVAALLLDRVPERAGVPLRFPRLAAPMSWLLIAGAAGLVAGPWLGILPLVGLGLVAYVSGTALLLINLVGTVRAGRRWTPELAHLLLAYLWMAFPVIAAPLVVLRTGEIPRGEIEATALSALVTGWILQIVIGAFLPRLRQLLGNGGDWIGGWFSVAAVNLGVLLVWVGVFAGTSGAVVAAIGYALVIAGWLPPLFAVVRRPRAAVL